MKLIFIVSLLIHTVLNIQTTILQQLTKADQQSLIIAKELLNVVQYERYFNKEQFTCLALLPTNLTKANKQKVHKLNVTYNFKHEMIKNPHSSEPQKEIVDVYEDYDYDKILDLLHGACAVYETNEFLWEYCHKEKIRQFDSLSTMQRMGKPQFEDINLGYYDYQKALKNSNQERDKAYKTDKQIFRIQYSQTGELSVLSIIDMIPDLTEKDKQVLKETLKQAGVDENSQGKTASAKVVTVPTKSVIYDQKNLFTVDAVNHKQYQLDKQNSVIHLNFPIMRGNSYFLTSEIIHQVTCEYTIGSLKSVYISRAMVISAFQLAFLGNVSKCDKIVQIHHKPIEEKPFTSPVYTEKIRQINDFLYGYVEEVCTNNWDWSMGKKQTMIDQRQNYLEDGTTLLIEVALNHSGIIYYDHYPITVKKVIAPGVVKLKENIRQKILSFKHMIAKHERDPAWINSCRIISKRELNHTSQNSEVQILRKSIIRIKQHDENLRKKQPGDQMMCLCRFRKYTDQHLEMHLTLGNKIFEANQNNNLNSYYEFYQKRTVRTYSQEKKQLYDLCSALRCFDVISNSQAKQPIVKGQGFTSITKLTAGKPALSDSLQTQNQIMIIDISQNGMIKIHTQSEDEEKHFYLITTSFLLKVKIYPNGTKLIIRENSFYQNQTVYNYLSWFGNSLFIHKNYIWRGYDKIVFPSMDFINQRITQIQRITGYAFVRTLDLSKMKHKNSHMITLIRQRFEEHFTIKKYPIFKKQILSVPEPQQNPSNPSTQNQEIPQPLSNENILNQENSDEGKSQTDFSKIDFRATQRKPLNKSVSVRYQYFHGDFCSAPINKHRRTDVHIQCGEPWLKIEQVKQKSPCVYELKVSTRLLCRQDYEKTLEKIQALNKNHESRVKLEKSMVCYPQTSWDNVEYTYDTDNRDIIYSWK